MKKKTDVITRLTGTPAESDIADAVSELRNLRRELKTLKSANRLYRISKASDAECAADKECFSPLVSIESKRKWIDDHDLFMTDGRVFAAVDTMTHIYFMDAITGSLYNFGECMTSIHGRTGFVRDHEMAEKLLMRFRVASLS